MISLGLAGLFAWLIERTDVPFKSLAFVVILLPIALPSILFVLSWTVLLAPRTGLINVVIRPWLDMFGLTLRQGPFDIYNLRWNRLPGQPARRDHRLPDVSSPPFASSIPRSRKPRA